MTKLEQLAETAKQAQRNYDNARVADEQRANKVSKALITATSTEEGFEWDCNAPSTLVIQHTNATIQDALATLDNNPIAQMKLVMGIMDTLQSLAEAKKNDS